MNEPFETQRLNENVFSISEDEVDTSSESGSDFDDDDELERQAGRGVLGLSRGRRFNWARYALSLRNFKKRMAALEFLEATKPDAERVPWLKVYKLARPVYRAVKRRWIKRANANRAVRRVLRQAVMLERDLKKARSKVKESSLRSVKKEVVILKKGRQRVFKEVEETVAKAVAKFDRRVEQLLKAAGVLALVMQD